MVEIEDRWVPDDLYKYASQDAALAILSNQSLKFSQPALFNDEFDMRVTLDYEVDISQAASEISERLWRIAAGFEVARSDNLFGKLIRSMTIRRDLALFRKGEFIKSVEGSVRNHLDSYLPQNFPMLSRGMALLSSKMKVLCLSESALIPPMWASYAEDLRGLVLHFAPRSEGSIFLQARRVEYQEGNPVLMRHEDVVDWLSAGSKLDDERITQLCLYTKTEDWRYEREWRIVAGEGWAPKSQFEFIPFAGLDLVSVIFGTRASEDFTDRISALVHSDYPATKLKRLNRLSTGSGFELVDA